MECRSATKKKDENYSTTSSFPIFLRHTKSGDRWSVERFRRNILHGIITISTAESAVAGSVPLGVLTPPMQRALLDAAEHSDSTIILTPWRGVIVTPVPTDQASNVAALLQEAGLVLDPASRGAGSAPASAPPAVLAAVATPGLKPSSSSAAYPPPTHPTTDPPTTSPGANAPAVPRTPRTPSSFSGAARDTAFRQAHPALPAASALHLRDRQRNHLRALLRHHPGRSRPVRAPHGRRKDCGPHDPRLRPNRPRP